MISDEAVEAAAYALFLDANPDSEVQWFDIGFHEQDELMRTARAVLEAAAPFVIQEAKAEAWDEGVEYRGEHVWPEDYAANPYRSQA